MRCWRPGGSARRPSATRAISTIPAAAATTSATTSAWPASCATRAPTSSASRTWAGLAKPAAARELVEALKAETGLPVHFHTHDTSGIAAASVLAAVEAGVDAVDLAMDSLSGFTSQPCWARWWRRCAAGRATPASTPPASGRSPTTGRRCGRSTRRSRPTCARRPPRCTCTRCRAGSSRTCASRPDRSASPSAGTRWRAPTPR